jgi:hypothetical protein
MIKDNHETGLEGAIEAIKSFKKMNRCSLNKSELVLLNVCINVLKISRHARKLDILTISKMVEILLKLILAADTFKKLFS